MLDQLDLVFRLPVTVSSGVDGENEEFLKHIFGLDWSTYVVIKEESDDGIDKNFFDAYPDSIVAGLPTKYKYYRFNRNKFITTSGERLSEIVMKSLSFIVDTKQPCPNDQFIIIVVLIALTLASAGTLAPEAGAAWTAYVAYYAAIISGILSIGLATRSFGKRESELAQYALYVTALVSGISAITSSSASWATYMSAGMQIANTAISGMEMYNQNQHTNDMKKLEKESQQLDEESAEEFERAFRFFYGESYDSIYRDGHEAHPHKFIYETYKEFSVY